MNQIGWQIVLRNGPQLILREVESTQIHMGYNYYRTYKCFTIVLTIVPRNIFLGFSANVDLQPT